MIKTLVKHAHIRVPKVLLLTARRVNSIRTQELLDFSKADKMMFKPFQTPILLATIDALLADTPAHTPTVETAA